MKKFIYAAAFLLSSSTYGANIAVIDSGLDYQHEELQDIIWTNAEEVSRNRIDDDANGYIDDVRGWNFANNHSILIEYDDEQFYRPDIAKFLDIQARAMTGEATKGEILWAEEILRDRDFINAAGQYLNYAHGTHVGGIMTRGLENVKVIDIRIIPGKAVEEAEQELKDKVVTALNNGEELNFIIEFIFKAGLKFMAMQNSKPFTDVAKYLNEHNTLVANASVGIGIQQARGIVTPILQLILQGNMPSQSLVDEFAGFFLKQMRLEQKKAFALAPNTLFVFAAGNDGVDNDQFPTVPASVRLDNTIAVGASIANNGVAPFSSYGALAVEVFAPGVGIQSIAPMDRTLGMSGTSQAAPMVARVASSIRLKNPELSPLEVKGIIMGTVDRKSFLAGMAYTEGLINEGRAKKAAELSLSHSLRDAIKISKAEIADAPEEAPSIVKPLLIGTPLLPSFR